MGGFKNLNDPKSTEGKPMISHVNDAINRTHRLTGMPHYETVWRGLIVKEIPMYGVAGALTMGRLAAQDRYSTSDEQP